MTGERRFHVANAVKPFALLIILLALSPAAWAAGGAMPSLVHDIGISLLAAGALGVIFTGSKFPVLPRSCWRAS